MAPALKQPPKYESRLILPRRPWPTRPGSYTVGEYGRGRTSNFALGVAFLFTLVGVISMHHAVEYAYFQSAIVSFILLHYDINNLFVIFFFSD